MSSLPTYVGLLDSRCEDEKIEIFLEGEGEEVTITLRAIARSELGWYPRKTISFHPEQLQALEILVKRARALLAARADDRRSADSSVIPLPFLGCPAVAE